MKRTLKLKKIVMLLAAAVLVAAGLLLCENFLFPKTVNTELQFGNKVSKRLELISENRKTFRISELKGSKKVLFYLSGKDAACAQRLYSISRIISIYQAKDIAYYLIWEDTIPTNWITAAGIDINLNYRLKDGNSLSRTKPNAYIIGAGNKVEYVTGYTYDDLPLKLCDICGSKDLRPLVNRIIVHDALQSEDGSASKYNSYAIMFLSTSCRDCLAEEQALKSALPKIRAKTKVITVQPDYDQTQVFENRNYFIDYSLACFDVYRQASRAEKLPYFVIVDQNMKIVKEFSDVSGIIRYYQ